jgi:hypothetical protein
VPFLARRTLPSCPSRSDGRNSDQHIAATGGYFSWLEMLVNIVSAALRGRRAFTPVVCLAP